MRTARPVLPWALAGCLALAGAAPALAADPGVPYPVTSEAAQKAGAVLLFSLVASDGADPEAADTRLSLTNRSVTEAAFVRLFFVHGETGNATDSTLCLTAGQTASLRASELRPGVTGFVVAVAVDGVTGCPVPLNVLAGQAQIRLASGFGGSLGALGVAGLGPAPPCAATAELTFDGITYNHLPRALHLVGLGSRADERTLLVVNRLGGDLTAASDPIGGLTGTLHDDSAGALGFAADTGTLRQFLSELTDAFPSTAPPFETAVPAGRTGWLRLFGTEDVALTAAALVVRPQPAAAVSAGRVEGPKPAPLAPLAAPGALLGALNLRTSTLANPVTLPSLVIPVAPPTC